MIISLSGKKQSGKDTISDIIKSLIYCEINETVLTEDNFESTRLCQIYNFKNKKFAGKLKEVAAIMLGCNPKDFESEEFKNSTLGEEWWYYRYNIKDEDGFTNTGYLAPYLEECRTEHESNMFHICGKPVLVKMTPRLFLQRLATDAVRENLHSCSWINSTLSDYNRKEYWVITDTRFENEINSIRAKEPEFINIRVDRYLSLEEWCTQYEGAVKFLKNPKGWDSDYKFTSNDFLNMFLFSSTFDDCIEKDDEKVNMLINNLCHESEIQLDSHEKFDYYIKNNGSIGELIEKVRNILVERGIIK